MCLTDIFSAQNKKYFKKCRYFKKKKPFHMVSRSSSTAHILKYPILKSKTCSVYTLASLNSLIDTKKHESVIDQSQSTVSTLQENNDTIYKAFNKNDTDTVPRTPLHEAAIAGQLSAIQWLLKYTCCTLNETDANGCNVLHLAAKRIGFYR